MDYLRSPNSPQHGCCYTQSPALEKSAELGQGKVRDFPWAHAAGRHDIVVIVARLIPREFAHRFPV